MTLLDVVLIALIKGIADVLPLGASGHLAVFGRLAADPDSRMAVLVAAEIGITLALMVYFWRDLFAMGRAVVKMAKGRMDPGGRLLLQVLAGSLPALAINWFLAPLVPATTALTAASFMLLLGLALWAADRLGVTVRRVEHLGWLGAVVLGLFQVAGLIPGVSRTAITVTAARLMGFERRDAARFSLLLAIPLMGGHAALLLWQLSHTTRLILSSDLALATGIAAACAWVATAIMLAWVNRHSYTPFAAWSVGLGVVVVAASLLG